MHRTRLMRDASMHSGLTRVGGTPAGRSPTPQPANLRHMRTVGADGFAALATGGSRFVGGEFMRLAAFMGGSTTLAGDLTLPFGTH